MSKEPTQLEARPLTSTELGQSPPFSRNPIPRNLLVGMFYIETHLPEGQSLASNRLSQKLLDRGYNQVMDSITAAMRLRGKGRPSTCAEGILAAINYRARNPLKLREVAEENGE